MFSNPQQNIEKVNVDPGMKIADLGSGAGHYSIAAAKLVGPSGNIYAVDVQKELLEKKLVQILRLWQFRAVCFLSRGKFLLKIKICFLIKNWNLLLEKSN